MAETLTHDQAQARIRELEAALHNLENACDLMASTRSQRVYDTMIAEQETELFALDKARLSARDALKSPPAPVNGESEELRAALKSALAWVQYWRAVVAGNLKPTGKSLARVEREIKAALSKREVK